MNEIRSLSLILFGMFLIMTVVLVSSPCSILFRSSWFFSEIGGGGTPGARTWRVDEEWFDFWFWWRGATEVLVGVF